MLAKFRFIRVHLSKTSIPCNKIGETTRASVNWFAECKEAKKKTELLCLKKQGEHMPSKNGGFSTWDDENPNIKPFGHEPSKATHFFKTSLKVVTWKSRHENHRSLLCFGVCCSFPFVTQDPPPSLSSVRTCSGERSTYSAWNSLEHQGGKTCTTWLRQKHVVKPSWIFHFRGSIIWNLSPNKVMFV